MRRQLGRVVLEKLLAEPKGFKEYELARCLGEEGMLPWNPGGLQDHLILFQAHFLLFHTLYHLRDRLRQEGRFDLSIHCLSIVLLPPRTEEYGVEDWDPVEGYYRNLDNLTTTDAKGVEEMLDWFWKAFHRRDGRQEALAILGLPDEADSTRIKQRFRELAMLHHPDRGGDAETFRKVYEAMEMLKEPTVCGTEWFKPHPAT